MVSLTKLWREWTWVVSANMGNGLSAMVEGWGARKTGPVFTQKEREKLGWDDALL